MTMTRIESDPNARRALNPFVDPNAAYLAAFHEARAVMPLQFDTSLSLRTRAQIALDLTYLDSVMLRYSRYDAFDPFFIARLIAR